MKVAGERKLGVGIVGLGWVAGEHLKAWQANPHSEVVALCSRDRAKAEAWGRQYGLQSQAYDDYETMLRDPRVDVVSICTRNDQHAGQGIAAAQAGKHLLIEKPIAMNLEELRDLTRAIEQAGVHSETGFVLRWNPYFQIVRSLLDADVLGPVFYGEFDYISGNWPVWYSGFDWARTRAVGGSSYLVAGCHAVDAMRWFMPGEAVEVIALAGNFTGAFEYDPTICSLVRFSSGAIAKCASIIEGNTPYTFNVRLNGAKGTLVNNRLTARLIAGQTSWAEIPTVLPDTPQVAHHPFPGEVNDLAEAITNNRPALVNIRDAFQTHEIIFAAEQSAADGGRPVKLPLS